MIQLMTGRSPARETSCWLDAKRFGNASNPFSSTLARRPRYGFSNFGTDCRWKSPASWIFCGAGAILVAADETIVICGATCGNGPFAVRFTNTDTTANVIAMHPAARQQPN